MKIFCWIVRGLGSPSKRVQIKSLVSSFGPDIIIFTETKLSFLKIFRIKSLWFLSYVNWLTLDSNGCSGEIMIIWNDLKFKIINTIKGSFSISIHIENDNGFTWWLTTVYAAKSISRDLFWNELNKLQNVYNPSWLIAADFNIVRWKNEINTNNLDKNSMAMLERFIQRKNLLIDPLLSNNKYTWSNLRMNPVSSRLDHFVFTKAWEQNCSQHFSRTLVIILSDHFSHCLGNNSNKVGSLSLSTEHYLFDGDRF